MKNIKFLSILALTFSILIVGCSDDDNPITESANLTLDITGLDDLGDDYTYEGWIIVDGNPISTGVFNVDANRNLSETTFELEETQLNAATAFVLTIEPSPDPDPAPSEVHILAGDFIGNEANVSVGHAAAIGNDFTNSTGGYILATPTDGANDTDERSGVWFLDPSGPAPALDLPLLPAGWIYEGWAVIDGVPVSTGRFTEVSGSDDSNIFSGSNDGPPYPGEDFLVNAPSGLTFPVDLSGMTVVVSVEPFPDNSPAPFTLKPLVANVNIDAADHFLFDLSNNASQTNPLGLVRR